MNAKARKKEKRREARQATQKQATVGQEAQKRDATAPDVAAHAKQPSEVRAQEDADDATGLAARFTYIQVHQELTKSGELGLDEYEQALLTDLHQRAVDAMITGIRKIRNRDESQGCIVVGKFNWDIEVETEAQWNSRNSQGAQNVGETVQEATLDVAPDTVQVTAARPHSDSWTAAFQKAEGDLKQDYCDKGIDVSSLNSVEKQQFMDIAHKHATKIFRVRKQRLKSKQKGSVAQSTVVAEQS